MLPVAQLGADLIAPFYFYPTKMKVETCGKSDIRGKRMTESFRDGKKTVILCLFLLRSGNSPLPLQFNALSLAFKTVSKDVINSSVLTISKE